MLAKARSRIALPSASMLVALCALVSAVGGVAVAAIPNSATEVITGCYGPLAGNLRVINAQVGQKCTSAEKTLTWNQEGKPGTAGADGAAGAKGDEGEPGTPGVAGAKGDTGATGLTGAPGAPGPAGVIGSVVVHRTDIPLPAGAVVDTAGAATSGFATCAAGEKLIGGSASIGNVSTPPTQEILISRPSMDDVGNGAVPVDGGTMAYWKGTGRTLTNVSGIMRVFAFCAVA
jgi:hypothetical protein